MKYLILIISLLLPACVEQGNCTPRAFFNATTWAISSKQPVYIAHFPGHLQAVGYQDGELHYLAGDGWNVYVSKRESAGQLYRLMTLSDAIKDFIRQNPTCEPSTDEYRKQNNRVRSGWK